MNKLKKIKNLAMAVALGLIIGVQAVAQVRAAEAMPMDLVTCSKCGTAMNVDIESKATGYEEGPFYKCTQRDHLLKDCWIYKARYLVSERYVCPGCGASKDKDTYYTWKEVHRVRPQYSR